MNFDNQFEYVEAVFKDIDSKLPTLSIEIDNGLSNEYAKMFTISEVIPASENWSKADDIYTDFVVSYQNDGSLEGDNMLKFLEEERDKAKETNENAGSIICFPYGEKGTEIQISIQGSKIKEIIDKEDTFEWLYRLFKVEE